ncbi:L-threonylcarbamoyladenylate synthase [Nitrosomonas ureae]|uniref:Threonylcarbamoyl-AMP synthase n=1 Tax=Nitrosomonas ureae TaxID=44577 RepID=A0A1H2E3Z2_9PROT|nr:L-threonylcarbamoyladenylate synthase [Nitrosomonas ureae]ALQ52424.1 translation factor Sua5 [Nitrosomonas ureae]SDT89428.1 translation factor SUA5 [Nitrosomonas ureae]
MKHTQYAFTQSDLSPVQLDQITAAAQILRTGGIVAFPTETVYGLGADVTNPVAIEKIYKIKQRPIDHPLIVHIGNISHLHYWAQAISDSAWKLANHFWPGPLTLILPRSNRIPDSVTGGQGTVGIRFPAHPVALALLRALGPEKALAAPSANRFGRISPTLAAHVHQELGSTVDMILDGGACNVGLESTIVSFHDEIPQILRPGSITLLELEAALNNSVILAHHINNQSIRTSGSLPAHYAPMTPLRVYSNTQIWQQAFILAEKNLRVMVITWSNTNKPEFSNQFIEQFSMPEDPVAYGRQLYAKLRQFDQAEFDYMLIESPPDHPNWLAIADRLQRASYHSPDNN